MQRPTARLLQITFGGPETDLHPKTDMSKQDFAMAMASLRSGAPSSNPRIPRYSCTSQAGCATWTWRHVILILNSVRPRSFAMTISPDCAPHSRTRYATHRISTPREATNEKNGVHRV